MKRITTILFCLSLLGSLAAESLAATSGSYRCTSSGTFRVRHYNPNGNNQTITRVRFFDIDGTVLLDSPGLNIVVPGRGSTTAATASGFEGEGLQVIVNWTQQVDANSPIPRLEELFFSDTVGDFTSESSRACP